MAQDRRSEASEPPLVTDRTEIARIESENALKQFDAAMSELEKWLGTASYRIRPSLLLRLNRIALDRLSKYAGNWRPDDVKIEGSGHKPGAAIDVPTLAEEFCDYVNNNWHSRSAVHLAAYALWRINWIHPFVDGNGRTARIVSYLILCARLGYRLPGEKTIPDQISEDKTPYYAALESADKHLKVGSIDVTDVEELIKACLASQLLEVHNDATKVERFARRAATYIDRPVELPEQRQGRWSPIKVFEKYPVTVGAAVAILITILGILFGT